MHDVTVTVGGSEYTFDAEKVDALAAWEFQAITGQRLEDVVAEMVLAEGKVSLAVGAVGKWLAARQMAFENDGVSPTFVQVAVATTLSVETRGDDGGA